MIILNWVVFVAGFVCGSLAVVLIAFNIGKRALEKKKAAIKESLEKEDGSKLSVDERLMKVKEITKEQLALSLATALPQKNAMDGKYQNRLIRQVKQLEEEKTAILMSILDDGEDPEVTVQQEDETLTTMKLSEFMMQQGMYSKKSNDLPASSKSRFTVYQGGKSEDDGGETTH